MHAELAGHIPSKTNLPKCIVLYSRLPVTAMLIEKDLVFAHVAHGPPVNCWSPPPSTARGSDSPDRDLEESEHEIVSNLKFIANDSDRQRRDGLFWLQSGTQP